MQLSRFSENNEINSMIPENLDNCIDLIFQDNKHLLRCRFIIGANALITILLS